MTCGVEMARDKKDVRRLIGVIRDKVAGGAIATGGFYTAAELAGVIQDVIDDADRLASLSRVRPRKSWTSLDGPVLWWKLPVDSAPFVGTPDDAMCSEDFTHWTPLPLPFV